MKRLEEYTNPELRELTEDKRQDLIDLECAVAGVRLLPILPDKPENLKPEKDLTLYQLSKQPYFIDKEEAEAVLALVNQCKRGNYYSFNGEKWDPDESLVGLELQDAYSPELHSKISPAKTLYEETKSAYVKAKKEFDDISTERTEITTSVHNAIRDANDEQDTVDKYRREYTRYVALANGDVDIAMNFLTNAYPDEKEVILEMKQQIIAAKMLDMAAEDL